jgi:hypothetical protein
VATLQQSFAGRAGFAAAAADNSGPKTKIPPSGRSPRWAAFAAIDLSLARGSPTQRRSVVATTDAEAGLRFMAHGTLLSYRGRRESQFAGISGGDQRIRSAASHRKSVSNSKIPERKFGRKNRKPPATKFCPRLYPADPMDFDSDDTENQVVSLTRPLRSLCRKRSARQSNSRVEAGP